MGSRTTLRCVIVTATAFGVTYAADARRADLERRFTQSVQPFVKSYCIGCHSGASAAAQFDLSQYSNLAAVVRDYPRWNLVLEKLTAREMPPKPVPPPPEAKRQSVIDWVQALRKNEAQKNAGDPGIVLARRLSNAEYNYTIRDLTGVDMRPTHEFPVDPANPAGFDNSGESLAMSPALIGKYLQAARDVANHMVLNLDGFAFADYPMLVETDREKYAIQRIVDFYRRQPTDYADYFEAAWVFKNRAILSESGKTLDAIAADRKVSPKYLATIWQALETPEDVGPLAKIQRMWRALPAPNAGQPDVARPGCVAMRDFVTRLRHLTFRFFRSPRVAGLAPTSQPLMNWRLRQFATHRRDFDRAALRVEGESPAFESALRLDAGAVSGETDRAAVKEFVAAILKGRQDDPDLAVPAGQRDRYEAAFARFSSIFPDAFHISERGRFYPIDTLDKGRLLSAGFHNVMGFYRDDAPLKELILDEKGGQELERLWQEFDFIADHTIRTYVQYYFNQSGEVQGHGNESGTARPADKEVIAEPVIMGLKQAYLAKAATSRDPDTRAAIEEHFDRVNATIRWVERARAESQPHQIEALVKFAGRAYRRPLTATERDGILTYYHQLREKDGLSHEDAMRDSLASVLMAPEFLYRVDVAARARPAQSSRSAPLSNYSIANRLSYFLWSSMPDDELMRHAAAGDLHKPDVLRAEVQRMLKDDRARGLATEFGGNWLDFRRFDGINTVDRERFPSFDNDLRAAMFEEPVRFLSDIIHRDGSVLDLLYGDYTFVNAPLAKHYGVAVTPKPGEWARVENAHEYGRGGLLAMAAFLTQNAPGLRTSPVKRGYWVARRVLGEVIPPPPATVPELPNDEAKMDLPLPQMMEKHRANPTCAACHARFDSFGLVFEGYGPVGERRTTDLAGRRVHTQTAFPRDGGEGDGLAGLQSYIRTQRQADFSDNLCRKMLAYALGRSLILSDELLIDQMRAKLVERNYRFSALVETIIESPQFLTKRVSGGA